MLRAYTELRSMPYFGMYHHHQFILILCLNGVITGTLQLPFLPTSVVLLAFSVVSREVKQIHRQSPGRRVPEINLINKQSVY